MQKPQASRWTCLSALAGAAVALVGNTGSSRAAEIAQPAKANPEAFMKRAFLMKDTARDAGDQAYGAVVVQDGTIIGQAPSRVVTANDPSAHAEMEAIRDAARSSGSRNLSGAVLYSSSRPCPMCEGAASYAGISEMVHGKELTSAGQPRLRRC